MQTSTQPEGFIRIQKTRNAGAGYYLFLGVVSGIFLLLLSLIDVKGAYHFAPAFRVFRRLLYIQYAVFASAVLSGIIFFARGGGLIALLRSLALAAFYFLFVWIALWSLVQRSFGIELTPGLINNALFVSGPISEMGVSRSELVTTLIGTAFIMLAGTALTTAIARRTSFFALRRGFFVFAASFVVLHVAVRSYFAYQIAGNDYASLAYDDCVPFPLRTEQLWPGSRGRRIALPNYASPQRTKAYLAAVQRGEDRVVPKPRNILFLNIESLRFDAVSEAAMPRLSAFRHHFQLHLNANHWSGANATHMSIFSMLTGVSGYYVPAFRYAGVSDPFLGLLLHNGYRVRFGKKAQIDSADLPGLIPSGAIMDEVDGTINCGDPQMVDHYLIDRNQRPSRPSFDFLAFDATHWPYSFDQNDAVFLPAPMRQSYNHTLLSNQDLIGARNRYNDACHGVDRQIGRVLDDLERRGGFRDTIVVVLGDHGEEFQERGQMTHSAVSNDFQGRTILWMHFPDDNLAIRPITEPTTHLDIVPTILQALGLKKDVLYTQGYSLLGDIPHRPLLSLAEQGGLSVPLYRCLVTPDYISSWRYGREAYLFCSVQRRDGKPVEGTEWLDQVRQNYENAAHMYDLLPDVSEQPRPFNRIDEVAVQPNQ